MLDLILQRYRPILCRLLSVDAVPDDYIEHLRSFIKFSIINETPETIEIEANNLFTELVLLGRGADPEFLDDKRTFITTTDIILITKDNKCMHKRIDIKDSKWERKTHLIGKK